MTAGAATSDAYVLASPCQGVSRILQKRRKHCQRKLVAPDLSCCTRMLPSQFGRLAQTSWTSGALQAVAADHRQHSLR